MGCPCLHGGKTPEQAGWKALLGVAEGLAKSLILWLTHGPSGAFALLPLLSDLTLRIFLSAFVLLKTQGQAGSRSVVLIRLSCCLVPSVLFPLGGNSPALPKRWGVGTVFIAVFFLVVIVIDV